MTSEDDLKERIQMAHLALPRECRYQPASEAELQAFETRFTAMPTEYRWYLVACGGGVVGSEWIDGIKQLPTTHAKFTSEPWTMKNVFVIGWDGAGNPFGIETSTGKVLVEDHTFGGVHEMAESFMTFLQRGLLEGYAA